MSKTHVPPQCAGNRDTVERRLIVIDGNRSSRNGRSSQGGMHVLGLCVGFNQRAGRWDDGYRELHEALGPAYFADQPLHLPHPIHRPTSTPIRAGAAARSILAGALALDPQLRDRCPSLPTSLRDDLPFDLPDELELRLANAYGRRARITGGMAGFDVFGPDSSRPGREKLKLGNMTIAQAHFAPVAWQLVHSGGGELCDSQGWAHIGSWTQLDPHERIPLDSVCGPLPMVAEVRDPRAFGERWIEMYANPNCFIVQCDDIAPTSPP